MRSLRSIIAVMAAAAALLLPGIVAPQQAKAYEIDVRDAVEYFEAQVGKDYDANACLYFVRTSWQNLGAPGSTTCCANKYGEEHLISTSMDNIPVGADVYFSGGSVPCECGRTAGHVGVYVGDGYMVHNYGYTIRKDLVSDVAHWGKLEYMGWGYHGNVTITGYVDAKTQVAFDRTSYAMGDEVRIIWGGVANADSYELQILDPWGYNYLKEDVKGYSSYTVTDLKPGRYSARINASNPYSTNKGDYYDFAISYDVMDNFAVRSLCSRFPFFDASTPQWNENQGDNLVMLCPLREYMVYRDALRWNGFQDTTLLATPSGKFNESLRNRVAAAGANAVVVYGKASNGLVSQLEDVVGAGNVHQR